MAARSAFFATVLTLIAWVLASPAHAVYCSDGNRTYWAESCGQYHPPPAPPPPAPIISYCYDQARHHAYTSNNPLCGRDRIISRQEFDRYGALEKPQTHSLLPQTRPPATPRAYPATPPAQVTPQSVAPTPTVSHAPAIVIPNRTQPDYAINRYFTSFTILLANPFVSLGIAIAFLAYIAVVCYGAHREGADAHVELLWPLFLFLVLGFYFGLEFRDYPYGHYRPGDFTTLLFDAVHLFLIIPYVMLFAFAHLVIPWVFVVKLPAFVRGFHFLFVPHPAEPYVAPALRSQGAVPVDTAGLANALEQSMNAPSFPSFVHENMARKAEKLAAGLRAKEQRLREETKLANAAVEHERARAARLDTKG